MDYKSLFINLENKSCFLIGGNRQAATIAQSLLEEKALVTVWSNHLIDKFSDLAKLYPGHLNLLQADFTPEVAEHYTSARVRPFIVITSLSNQEKNKHISEICYKNNVLCFNPSAENSESIIHNQESFEPVEFALHIKGMPILSHHLQDKMAKDFQKLWLGPIQAYQNFANDDFVASLSEAERRIILRRLAEKLVKYDGDFNLAKKETLSYYKDLLEQDKLLIELADERAQMD